MNTKKEEQIENLKHLFYTQFRKYGYNSFDSFDSTIWFIRNKIKPGISHKEYFQDLLTTTPKEDDDIIKTILFNCTKNHSKKYQNEMRVFVSEFIDELVKQIIFLHSENKHIEALIEKYSAYETVTTIEQNIIYFNKYEERASELNKSNFKAYISKIKGLSTGEYKFSLLISQESEMSNSPEQLEYTLKHVMRIVSNDYDEQSFNINEYEFPQVKFFCDDRKNESDYNDTRNNLLSFQLMLENLSKNYTDVIVSEKFKFIELLLSNPKALLNNFEKTKTLEANITLENSFYDIKCFLIFKVEFDPITLISVFHKINKLLKNIISYKIRVEHKFKTILSYFESNKEQIELILSPQEKQNGCNIF